MLQEVEQVEQWFTISQAAKLMKQGIGRTKLFRFLREEGLLMANNEPYQKEVDSGHFKMVLKEIIGKQGKPLFMQPVTLISKSGMDHVDKLLMDKNAQEMVIPEN